MGFWSDTFGGGNSFSESVANTFTPNDGYEYKRGDLVDSSTGNYVPADERARLGIGSADNRYTNLNTYNNGPSMPLPTATTPPPTNTSDGTYQQYNAPTTGNDPYGGQVTGLRSLAPFIGGAMLGPIGVAGGLAYKNSNLRFGSNPNNIPTIEPRKAAQIETKRLPVYSDAYIEAMNSTGELDTPEGRIQGSFFKNEGDQDDPNAPMYKMNRFGNTYRVDRTGQNYGNSSLIAEQAAAAGGEGGIAAVRPVGTQVTAPTSTMPAMSDMSREAAAGANMPIPNPNYDPNDPTSMKYIINPSYDQIVAYKRGLPGYTPVEPDSNMSAEMIQAIKNGTLGKVFGYAEGGEVEFALGGNEKDLINAAERAVRNGLQVQGMARGGDMDISNEDKIAIAQYVEQYDKPALMQLVDSVRTGEADETRKRFASGENGEVRGNGDGSGTDDKVPAKLKEGNSEQDVLLADGEFVLRKDATQALEKAGVSLNKINDAGPNAAKELSRYMTG